jgi:hypothetical protein
MRKGILTPAMPTTARPSMIDFGRSCLLCEVSVPETGEIR